jgi:hypothetical protein
MSLTRNKKPTPPPLLASRDAVRLLAALSMMVFLLWAMKRTGDPHMWSWVENVNRKPEPAPSATEEKAQSPAKTDVSYAQQACITQAVGLLALIPNPCVPPARIGPAISTVSSFEYLPWPELPTPQAVRQGAARHAPVPSAEILSLAIDNKGFLTDDPDEVNYANALRKGDADARYHLLELAVDARLEDLAQDARSDVRHSALLRKPNDYRGQVIHVQGQLRWLRTFELSRDSIPGVKFVYEGLITAGPDAYWVLFKDLPKGMPPASEWNKLYVHDATFNGYFLKVLLTKDEKTNRTVEFPLLVGRALELPPVAEGKSFSSGFWTLAIIVAGAALVLGLVFWLHTVGERRYAARLAAVRERAKQAAEEASASGAAGNSSDENQTDGPESPNQRNGWPAPSDN